MSFSRLTSYRENYQLTEMALDGNLSRDQRDVGVGPYEGTEDQTLGRTSLSGYQSSQLEGQPQSHNESKTKPYRNRNLEESWRVQLSWDS